jgi:hypothetical protein
MDLDVLHFEFRSAAKRLAENFFFYFELMLIRRVLVVASSARREVWASRRDAVWGWFEDFICGCTGEPGLLLRERGFNFLRREDEWDEHGFAAPGGVSGQTGQAVAAVDQLFDCEEQEMILRHGSSCTPSGRAIPAPEPQPNRSR